MKSLREHRDPQTFHLFLSAYLDARFGGAKLKQADGAYRLIVTSTSPVGRIGHSAAKTRVKVDGARTKAKKKPKWARMRFAKDLSVKGFPKARAYLEVRRAFWKDY